MTDATDGNRRRVALPAHLLERVDARLDRTDFDTREEYIAFVLEETLARVEAGTDEPRESRQEVQSRLESLGYLDS